MVANLSGLINGKKTRFKKGNIPWNTGKKLPYKPRPKMKGHVPWNKGKKMPNAKPPHYKGKDHYNWKGGITPINVKIRNSPEMRLWRKAVFERDKYTCVWCGAKNGKGNGKTIVLNADHIKRFADYPELRFAIDNGRTLCAPCHKTTDTYGVHNKK